MRFLVSVCNSVRVTATYGAGQSFVLGNVDCSSHAKQGVLL